jgi:ubiquinone/menaquinone biosynthesis C-methylase UbiE
MSAHTMPIAQGQGRTGYAFTASEPEHERIERMSRVTEPYVWETCARLGLTPGANVIEFGCGPRGALPTFSAAVGPDGLVVGVDRDADALEKARASMALAGVCNVHFVQADLNTLTPAEVCPFGLCDLAYCHFVLCYQTDVVAALRRMAATVRPGGYIVAQEALLTAPIPVETPGRFDRAANLLMNEWLPSLLGTMGTCWDVAERYSMLCREANLVEVDQRAFAPSFLPAHARTGIAAYRDILADARPLLRRFDIASDDKIDHVLHELDMALEEAYNSTIFTHIQAELVARLP